MRGSSSMITRHAERVIPNPPDWLGTILLASSPRRRGPIFQRRWLLGPACAGTTVCGVRGPSDARETDRLDAYAPREETAAAPCQTPATIPMAVPPGMGLGVRHLGRAVAALPPGAALPRPQPDLDLEALALGNGRARGAKLRADRAHGA